ncbi:LysR family transcriptional regulator [Yinghuangia sp. YIM S09857]|uniref:LysR family transcriptional regulator n=1 Tax=Yinghuangia sp. YIM S09857 TaxID=3436929 RepID=UPI003F53A243
MNLRDLESFLVVAEELHFGRAAQRLCVSQPMVSQSVRRLERELGGTLFDRSTRTVTLTAFGTRFQPLARKAHDAVVEAYAAGRKLARETPDGIVLAYARDHAGPLLDLVRELPPGAVELRSMPTPAQPVALRHRRVNAALGWDTPTTDGVTSRTLTHTGFAAIVPHDHPLTEQPDVTLAALTRYPVIGWPRRLSPELAAKFANATDPTGGWSFTHTGTSLDEIAAQVLAGRGVGVIIASLVDNRPVRGICFLTITDAPPVREVLTWRTDEPPALLPLITSLLAEPRHGE